MWICKHVAMHVKGNLIQVINSESWSIKLSAQTLLICDFVCCLETLFKYLFLFNHWMPTPYIFSEDVEFSTYYKGILKHIKNDIKCAWKRVSIEDWILKKWVIFFHKGNFISENLYFVLSRANFFCWKYASLTWIKCRNWNFL